MLNIILLALYKIELNQDNKDKHNQKVAHTHTEYLFPISFLFSEWSLSYQKYFGLFSCSFQRW